MSLILIESEEKERGEKGERAVVRGRGGKRACAGKESELAYRREEEEEEEEEEMEAGKAAAARGFLFPSPSLFLVSSPRGFFFWFFLNSSLC